MYWMSLHKLWEHLLIDFELVDVISLVWNVFVFAEANLSDTLALSYHPTSEAPQKLPPEIISCFLCLFVTHIESMRN